MTFHLVIEVHDERGPRGVWSFDRTPIRIGRNALNEVAIDSTYVSQWHGTIHVVEGHLVYVDLGSTNGTVLEGRRVPRNTPTPIQADGRTPIVLGRLGVFVRPARPGEGFHGPGLAQASSFDAPVVSRRATQLVSAHEPGTHVLQTNHKAVLEDALGAVDRLRAPYDAYRAAASDVLRQLRMRLEALPASMRAPTLRNVLRELPELAREPELLATMDALGLPREIAGTFDARAWLARLSPEATEVAGELSLPVAMERVGAALEVFAQAFVELRNGKTAFCEEMGVVTPPAASTLDASGAAHDVLAFVLDWDADGLERLTMLRRAFADLAMHQVALVAGVAEGGRALLDALSPRADGLALRDASWLARLLPITRLAALGRGHRALEEEDAYVRVLFGESFARAYYLVLGERLG